jgi:hypothetical protein
VIADKKRANKRKNQPNEKTPKRQAINTHNNNATKLKNTQAKKKNEKPNKQQTNRGYMLRIGFELAYNTALLFQSSLPQFVALDDMAFHKPV